VVIQRIAERGRKPAPGFGPVTEPVK